MTRHLRVLIVEDDLPDAELVLRELSAYGFSLDAVLRVETRHEFVEALSTFRPDIIISDYALPAFDGLTALVLARQHAGHIPFILCTGSINEETAVSCMRAGADDYVLKDHLTRLPSAVASALERAHLCRQAEESEANYRLLADNTADVIWTLDVEAKSFTYVSPSILQLRGYTVQETLAQSVEESMAPASYAVMSARLAERLFRFLTAPSEAGPFTDEIEQPHKSGSTVWTEVVTRFIRDARGAVCLLGVSRDITQQRQTKEALRASEEMHRSLYENATLGLYRTTPEGRILMANPALVKMLGFDSFDAMATRDLNQSGFAPAYPRTHFIEAMERDGAIHGWEALWSKQDGTSLWIREGVTTVRDKDGQALFYDGTVEDITERKQYEELLRESSARLELALRSARMGTWHWAILENRRYFDEQTCHLLGLAPERFTGAAEEFFGAVHPDDRDTIKAALARTIEQDLPYEPQYRTVWADGSVHHIASRGRLVRDSEGRPTRIHGIIWDVTEAEEAKQERERAEQVLVKLRKAIDASGDVIFITDPQGVFTFVNSRFTAIYGYTASEVLGKATPRILKGGTLEPKAYEEFWKAILSGKEVRGEIFNKRKDGKWIPMDRSVSPIFDPQDSLVGFLSIQHDNTERRRADEALKASEEKYRLLADYTYDWETWTGPDGLFRYISHSCERISGYPAQAFYADPKFLLSIIHPEDRPRLQRHYTEELSDPEPCDEIDFRILTPSGEKKWIAHTCQAIYGENGGFMGRRGTNRDITPRKEAEIQLRQSDEAFRTFFEANLAPSYLATPYGQILHCNTAFLDLFGMRSMNEAWRHSILDLFVSESSRRAFLAGLDAPGHTRFIETERTKVSGECLTVLESATFLKDGQGNSRGFVGFLLDMTDQRKVDNERRLLSAALEQTHDAIVVVNAHERILYMNSAFGALTGEDCGKLLAAPLSRSLHLTDKVVRRDIRETIQAGRTWSGQIALPRGNSPAVLVDARFSALPRKSAPSLAVGILRDVTEEEALKLSLARVRQIEDFGRIASGVAHEVRNPLFAISTVVAALERKTKEDAQLDPFIRHINDHVARLSKLMDDLLAMGRPLNPKLFVNCDLMQIVRDAMADLDAAHPGSRARFHLDLPSDLDTPFTVFGDHIRLSQSLLNIFSNSFSFALPETLIRVRLIASKDAYALTVTNDGPTIPEDLLPHIFEPFVTARRGGTGLGLTLVRQTLTAHNAIITVANLPDGKGVTFQIIFPSVRQNLSQG